MLKLIHEHDYQIAGRTAVKIMQHEFQINGCSLLASTTETFSEVFLSCAKVEGEPY